MYVTKEEFLDTIFADADPDTEQVCVSFSKKKKDKPDEVFFINHSDTDRQFRKWDTEKQARAWYFCVSTINGARNPEGTMVQRARANLVRYHVLVLDDIGTKTEAPDVTPTYKLETSEDNFHWGFALIPGADLARFEALVGWCHQQGWGDKGAGGSYRLMRIPGSANLKPGRDNFRSRVTEWNPSKVWTLDGLAAYLGCDLDTIEISSTTAPTTNKDGGAQAMDNIDPVLEWLVAQGLVVADKGGWVDIICPWADAHTSGANTAGYSPLGRGSDEWVQHRAFHCLHEHCVDQDLKKFRTWLKARGGPLAAGYDPLPWLQSRFVYVGMGQKVVDLEQRGRGGDWSWDFADWSGMHPGKMEVPDADKPVPVATAFRASKKTTKVEATTYEPVKPNDDTGVVVRNGQPLVNTYVPPNWPETDIAPTVFLEHMEYLVPDQDERELVVNWLAAKIQEPASRSYAVCMVAEDLFGVGRSWLREILERMLQGKVNTATLGQLIGKGTHAENNYNDWMSCQFLVVEEAKDDIDRDTFYAGYEKFKQVVDTRVGSSRINEKYGRTRTESIYFNCLIFTNHHDALALPKNDRRVAVVVNATKMNTPAYYDRLEASLLNHEPARLYWYLMRRDVSKYDRIYPPMTPSKMAMIEQNESPSHIIFDWVRENIEGDVITKDVLRTYVMLAAARLSYENITLKPGGVVRHIWGKCKNLRGEYKGARYVINGRQTEVRVLRNLPNWIIADESRDREKFVEGIKGADLGKNVVQIGKKFGV